MLSGATPLAIRTTATGGYALSNTAGVSGLAVVVDAFGQLGTALSSARYKRDITPMGTRSEKVLDLRPVTFA